VYSTAAEDSALSFHHAQSKSNFVNGSKHKGSLEKPFAPVSFMRMSGSVSTYNLFHAQNAAPNSGAEKQAAFSISRQNCVTVANYSMHCWLPHTTSARREGKTFHAAWPQGASV
jgi:hypothetical protein